MFFDRIITEAQGPELFFPKQFPADLDSAILSALGMQAQDIPKRLAFRLRELWPMLAKDLGRSAPGTKHYSFSRDLANAYLAYYLPANALKIAAVMEELRLTGVAAQIFSGEKTLWTDLGSGPGTLGLGLAWWMKQARAQMGNTKVALEVSDQSDQFLGLARDLLNRFGAAAALGEPVNYLRDDAGRFAAKLKNSAVLPDVVSFMNSWIEFGQNGLINEIIETFLSRKDSRSRPRWLVFIEPGSKNSSRSLLTLRDSLRANERVGIWLPCLSGRPCGALAKPDDWCHEEVAAEFPEWHSELGAQAGLRKEALLFSYLVVSVGGEERLENFRNQWPTRGERMVSQRMKEKGLTQCFFCTEEGKKKYRVLDSKRTDALSGFDSLCRGEILLDSKIDEKGSVLELGRHCFSATSIKSPIITES